MKKEYSIWAIMKNRCFNKNSKRYKDYGGRGVSVCDRWLDFNNFYEDMGKRPDGMSIDRINNDGNYEPLNCRWATPEQQANNKRKTKHFLYNGDTLTIPQFARKYNMSKQTIMTRMKKYKISINMKFKIKQK